MSSEHAAKSTRQLQIGKFRILAHIATGGMGAVYKAQDTEFDRIVALKVLSPEMAAKPRMIERFRLEALHGSKLHHPNVVTLYEAGEINGIHYLALEFVEGIDLLAYILQKGKLEVDESRRILIQATQAIAHLHQQGVIHRDIKPSNFLVRHQDGRPVVKLIDLGLARHRDDDEECRVTRVGSTVGTVDYIAPEQAKDSGAADVRSDIYSLGCTWYHMLAGQPPFTEGSMVERLYKHVEVEPPDIRTLNRDVPVEVVKVLKRMMAKEPSERYQTPAILLRELEGADLVVQPFSKRLLAGLAQDYDQAAEPEERPRRASRRRGKKSSAAGRRKAPRTLVDLIIGVAVVSLLAFLAARLALRLSPSTDDKQEEPPESSTAPVLPLPAPPTNAGPKPPSPSAKQPAAVPPKTATNPPAQPVLPKLYEPVLPIKVAELNQEFFQPWEKIPPLAAGPTFRVSRQLRGRDGQTFESLAAACAAAPANQETVIEIDANGPLFEGSITVTGRSLVLRAGKGYRPLLAWDARQAPAGKAEVFISLSGGRLTLDNLDVVFQATAQGQAEPAVLFRVADGGLTAQGCTFSVAGKHSTGVAVVRLEGTQPGAACRGRLSQCYVRGAEVIAVDLRVPGADVLLDGCLVAGGVRPLVEVRGPSPLTPATLRVRRSTLVAGQALFRLGPSTPTGRGPALRFLGWDALLARSGNQPEEALLVLQERADPNEIQWQATNCLYAGWKTLLKAPRQTITNLEDWRSHFHQLEGDRPLPRTWPALAHVQPAETLAEDYRPAGSSGVCFAATSGPGALGCDLEALPPARDNWLRLTYEQFIPAQVDLPPASAPSIPAGADNRYHGERLDLARVADLGQYLRDIQKNRLLGPRVVLQLTGTGEHPTSPIVWKGSNLVLCFEAAEEDAEPLVLVPNGITAADHEALIQVVDGNLDLVGGAIRFRDRKLAPLPAYMLKVRGGDLSLARCRLEGPLAQPPDQYRGLIHFEGAGNAAERTTGCVLVDSVLISARTLLRVANPGARLRMENCLLLANGDALEVDPGTTDWPRLEVQGTLRRNTIAVNRAVIHLKDAPRVRTPAEPILIQAKANIFMDPFTGPASQAGVLLYEGDALNRGLLVWQGQGNLYDKRFLFYALAEGAALPEKPQPYTSWAGLWGTTGDTQSVADVGLPHPFVLAKPPQLGQLVLPPGFQKPGPGADLGRLGLVKKAKK
jgi:serine/threonine-protein kinase